MELSRSVYNTNVVLNLDHRQSHIYDQFLRNIGSIVLEKAPVDDLMLAMDAYVFAVTLGHTGPFLRGLEKSILQGTVQKWSQTIIDQFTQNAKGGANYDANRLAA